MKKVLNIFCILFSIYGFSQVGINTDKPTNELDVNGDTRIRVLQAVDKIPTYVLSPDENGVIEKIPSSNLISNPVTTDVTRYLGGTVGVIYSSTSGGNIPNFYIINDGQGGTYQMGDRNNLKATVGGIVNIIGSGFKISNPEQGVFDIIFNVPFEQIYGISSNLFDPYPTASSTRPDFNTPGTRLWVRDNTQIAYIDNKSIRIKTGAEQGSMSNRPFTFIVVGK